MTDATRRNEPIPNGIYSLTAHFEGKIVDLKELAQRQIDYLTKQVDEVRNELRVANEKFAAMKIVDDKFRAASDALKTALDALNLRLVGMNEIKAAMGESLKTHVTRDELNGKLAGIEADTRMLRESRSELAGMATALAEKASRQSATVANGVAGIGLLIATAALIVAMVR